MQEQAHWWQTAVFYQIYPRSFADGDGDGIGDLAGMIDKLDYLRDLGIDAIWLSPHYPSPLYDCGYDVADYCGVAPEYGTLDDFRRFLDGAHQHGIRVVLDLVLNHTSHQHPWFLESRSSRDNPRRDWYVWRAPVDGGPPNNWNSIFGGPAWEYDEATGEYYYHFFLKEQPDLNWRNPAVVKAMFGAARFWLDMGVDGFRLDAIGTIYEDPALPNHTARWTQAEWFAASQSAETEAERHALSLEWQAMHGQQVDQPGVHELMRELRALVNQYPGRVLIGETDEIAYHGSGDDELHMVFNFPLTRSPLLTPEVVRQNQALRLAELPEGAWPCNTLGNHDSPRTHNRFGDGLHDAAMARISLAIMLTLRGTPFLYNGEEIGMTDYPPADAAQFRDLYGTWLRGMLIDVLDLDPEEATRRAALAARDKCRTPMQWSAAPNGGFCPPEVAPWLAVNPNYAAGVNVADQDADQGSLLNFYRRLLRVRRNSPALQLGDYTLLHPASAAILAYVRATAGQACAVVLNMTDREQSLALEDPPRRILFAEPSASIAGLHATLPPFGILIAEMPTGR